MSDVKGLREVLGEHAIGAFTGTETACRCDRKWRSNAGYRDHLADALSDLLAAATRDAEAVKRVRAWVASMDDLARQYCEAAATVTAPDLVTEATEHAEDVQASADGVRRALDGTR